MGFRLSSYKKGSTAVGPINHVTHVPKCMVRVVLQFQDFVRSSKHDVYHPETHQGCYRQITLRATSNDDIMMIIALSKKVKFGEKLACCTTGSCTQIQIFYCF